MSANSKRTARHHGDLKEALVKHAFSLAQSQSLNDLSLRKASRELGVSPGAAYKHFADKDALIRTVAQRGFDALAASFETALPFASDAASKADARARFVRLAEAYVGFARENYGLWRVMFGPFGLSPGANLDRPSTYQWLAKSLAEQARYGLIRQADEAAQFFAWSAIHGLSDLQASPAIAVEPGQNPVDAQCAFVIAALHR